MQVGGFVVQFVVKSVANVDGGRTVLERREIGTDFEFIFGGMNFGGLRLIWTCCCGWGRKAYPRG